MQLSLKSNKKQHKTVEIPIREEKHFHNILKNLDMLMHMEGD